MILFNVIAELEKELISVIITAVISIIIAVYGKILWDHDKRIVANEISNASDNRDTAYISTTLTEMKENNKIKFDKIFTSLEEVRKDLSRLNK
jgi:hypothetical protein